MISVIIPVIRKKQAKNCELAIRRNAGGDLKSGVDYEIITSFDKKKRGCTRMVKKLVEKTRGDMVMYIGDDCIPQQDFMINALEAMKTLPDGWGMVGLNGGRYWLCSKKLLPELDGEFLCTEYVHKMCDRELAERCRDLGRYTYALNAEIRHDHPADSSINDKVAEHDAATFNDRKNNGWPARLSIPDNELKIVGTMIMKNEEKNLDRCLKAMSLFCSDIVIVDTGSTDRSVEIAESYGAHVYHHEWQDNFSLHRNQSIEYAEKLNPHWLLAIDCDEEVFGNPDGLRHWLLHDMPSTADQANLEVIDHQAGKDGARYSHARLFKAGCVKFEYGVHNEAVTPSNLSYFCPHISLRHYGYDLDEAGKIKKQKRISTMLKKQLLEDPDRRETYFYLAQNHGWMKDHEKTLEYGDKYASFKEELGEKFKQEVYFTMFRACLALNDLERATQLVYAGIKYDNEFLDMYLAMSELGKAKNDMKLMITGASQFVVLYNQFSTSNKRASGHFNFTYTPEALAFCTEILFLYKLGETNFLLSQLENVLQKTHGQYKEVIDRNIDARLEGFGLKRIKQAA